MKKYLFALVAAALCMFTSCSKDEAETTESGDTATIADFYGSYDITIEESGIISTESETYTAELTIKQASANVVVTELESSVIAHLDFSTTDTNLINQEWYPVLDSVYGAVAKGYMTLVTSNVLQGSNNTLLFKGNTIAYKKNAMSWDAYFGAKTDNWLTSIASYKHLKFTATRNE